MRPYGEHRVWLLRSGNIQLVVGEVGCIMRHSADTVLALYRQQCRLVGQCDDDMSAVSTHGIREVCSCSCARSVSRQLSTGLNQVPVHVLA